MSSSIILFLLALIIWTLLNWPFDWQNFVIGIFVAGLVALLTSSMFAKRVHLFRNLKKYIWFLYYIPLFLWECLKANIDVAYRVGHPDLPIRPGIVKIKTNLKSEIALTFLANSITLTPGTMSIDIDKQNGYIYIHWIDVKDKDIERATKIIAWKFERILGKIFE